MGADGASYQITPTINGTPGSVRLMLNDTGRADGWYAFNTQTPIVSGQPITLQAPAAVNGLATRTHALELTDGCGQNPLLYGTFQSSGGAYSPQCRDNPFTAPFACVPTPGSTQWRGYNSATGTLTAGVQATIPGQPDFFDCSKPTVPIFHGWTDRPDAPWVLATAEAVRAMFPGGVNILIADIQQDFDHASAGTCKPESLRTAMGNVPSVVDRLGAQLRDCINVGAGCPGGLNIPFALGHSLGGAAAAAFNESLRINNMGRVAVLVTDDTPWGTFDGLALAGLADNRFTDMARQAPCHINLFAPFPASNASLVTCNFAPRTNGVGVGLNSANGVDLRVTTGLVADCPNYFHACLAEQLPGWLWSPQARDFLTNCAAWRGQRLIQSGMPNNWVPDTSSPQPTLSFWERVGLRMIRDPRINWFADLSSAAYSTTQASVLNGQLTIKSSTLRSPTPVGGASLNIPVTPDDGWLLFDYRYQPGAVSQQVGAWLGNAAVLTDSTPTPSTQWRTNLTKLDPAKGATQTLRLAMTAAPTEPQSGAFLVTNVRVLSRQTPLTPCPADFNVDAYATVQDIFDFLAVWFASDPRADFNGVGGVTVQDIFDFLAAWFQGC